MNDVTANLLAELRRAGAARDWNAVQAAALELMKLLPAEEALALAGSELSRRLHGFEAHHPGADGPRRLLAQLAAGVVPSGDDADPELVEYTGPGGNSFSAGLAALVRAVHAGDPDARASACVTAIAQAVMAESLADWGSRFPDEWRRWYEAESDGDDAIDVALARERDPAYGALQREAWARLADELERRLTEE